MRITSTCTAQWINYRIEVGEPVGLLPESGSGVMRVKQGLSKPNTMQALYVNFNFPVAI